MNSVQLIGNLGKDAQLSTINNSKKVSLSVATTENYKNMKGEIITTTTWHNIVAWSPLAEKMADLTKGSRVSIKGKINNRSYKDKDGNTKYISEIVALEYDKIEKSTEASMSEAQSV